MVGTGRANNVIRIPTSLQGKFFRIWIEFLTPLHNLTNKEKDVVAAFLKVRFALSKSVSEPGLLDKIIMSDDIKNDIKKECGVSDAFFKVILSRLKKLGIITHGTISPKFIPKSLAESDETFQLLLYFDLDGGDNK